MWYWDTRTPVEEAGPKPQKTFPQEARGNQRPNISARGPKAPEVCLDTFRSPLPEFHLSGFYLFLGLLYSDELSLNFDVYLGRRDTPY